MRTDQTARAKSLSTWLHEQIDGRRIPVEGCGDWGVALLQHSWDLADAIVTLLDRQLPGPAWTLSRALSESFVRGVWLLHCASDEQVERFRNGKRPSFPRMLEAMDDHDEAQYHARWIRTTMANASVLHDFTHGGIEHVLRRIDKDVVEPKYPEHELEYLVELSAEVYIRVGCELLSLMGDSDTARQLDKRVQAEWNRPSIV